uniref:Ankyrin repeat protein n=1 Tax=Marseillevirus LCMAC202 TaxID=2506606 RepID=A0A481YYT8_9VIRU|nr:MAG: ankyrin repeat protein [Marseillevirus LCMAC202]
MYSYKRCINLCIQDLLTYTDKQLYQLGGVMGLALDKDRDQLAEEIATMLINKNWRSRKAHMLEAELPYAGDIRKAMQEPDRRVAIPAIRAIQAWRAEHERERRKELVKEAQEKVLPEQAKDCSNEQDFITQDDWDANNLPQVKIKLLDKTNPIHGPSYTLCFRRDTLQQWIGDPKHEMAVWLPTIKGKGMDADGHGLPGSKGTGPSANSIYTQLPDGSYTAVPENVSLFDPKYTNFIGVPIATNIRLGNLAGTMGVSELHGQAPGKVIYLLIPAQDNLHNTLVTYFLDALLDRLYVNEVFALLKELQHTGLSKKELDDTLTTEEIETLIDGMTNEQLIKSLQELLDKYPAIDADYNDKGQLQSITTVQQQFARAIEDQNVDAVKRLLFNPRVDPTAHDNYAIKASSYSGHAAIVRLLLEDGRTDPTAEGSAALRVSSVGGHATVVELLLADGRADPTAKDNDAIRGSSLNGRAEVVKLLLEDGRADPTADNNYAIRRSSEFRHTDVLRLLLADGRADPTANDNYAIRLSSQKGYTDVVKLLLADGRADPTAKDNFAIRSSSQNGHTEVVKLLLADGRADPTADNNWAIRMSREQGHTDVVELLLQDPRVPIESEL